MRASRGLTAWAVFVALCVQLGAARAACLDPRTAQSGYGVPLATAVGTAEASVIGHMLSEEGLVEDPGDPDGVTAIKITIEVVERLKGKLPRLFELRNENTSSRYAIALGSI